jgi:hypothetical protein
MLAILLIIAGCTGAGGGSGGASQNSGSDAKDINSYVSLDCTVAYHHTFDTGVTDDGTMHFQGDVKMDPINGYDFVHGMGWGPSVSAGNGDMPTLAMTGEHTCSAGGKTSYDGPVWITGSFTHSPGDPMKSFTGYFSSDNTDHVYGHHQDELKYIKGELCSGCGYTAMEEEGNFFADMANECFKTNPSDPAPPGRLGSYDIPYLFENGYKVTYSYLDEDYIKKDSTITFHTSQAIPPEEPVSLAPLVTPDVTLAPLVTRR